MYSKKQYLIDTLIKIIMIIMMILLVLNTKAQKPINPVLKEGKIVFFVYAKASVLIYELNYDLNGRLNLKNPLKMKSYIGSGIQRNQDLTNIIKCNYIGNDGFEIYLSMYKKVHLYLLKSKDDDTYKIYLKNGTNHLLLNRVFVKLNKGSFHFPKYQYIDLITAHSDLGKEIIKQIDI